jgi:DNA repair protein RadA/Sms
MAQWVGRCPGCGAWGSIQEDTPTIRRSVLKPVALGDAPPAQQRVRTGFGGLDRVLGGGLVPGSVSLMAGEPGIGKSTLLLQVLAHLSATGLSCLLASGEESHAQIAARAKRLGIGGDGVVFAPGRDLADVIDAARAIGPALLAVDSIQMLRDTAASQMPGGVAQVRTCTDALVGLAKAEGISVLLIGHVTKDGDLAGPRALEHAVDVVLTFDGDARSGLRVLACGKNRHGAEGETAWFEMGPSGLVELDPTRILVSGDRMPGAAVAVAQNGRRAVAVEVQALVGSTDGPPRRHAMGLDPRRFQIIAAVLDRLSPGLRLGRAELFGASSGGVRVDDPACDLAIAAALTSAVTGVPPPEGAAFVGELSLTGQLRPAAAMTQRLAAARGAGCGIVFAPSGSSRDDARVHHVRHVGDALGWAMGTPTGARVSRGRSP